MVHIVAVDDPSDSRLDDYRSLKDAAQRVQGTFIAESELVIERLVQQRFPVRSLLLTSRRADRMAERLHHVDAPAFVASQVVLDQVVGFSLHRGALALAERVALPSVADLLETSRRVVVLEDVVDPDNVGAIFRHAAAFEADSIILSPHCGDPLYRKSVRTSMGWVLSVPYARAADGAETVDALHTAGFATLALTPRADVAPLRGFDAAPIPRLALLLGAESNGLRWDTMDAATHRVRIPMSPNVDSLNVASAAAIAMYELFGSER